MGEATGSFANLIEFIGPILVIISFVVGRFYPKILHELQSCKLKKILLFTGKKCFISAPTFKKHQQTDGKWSLLLKDAFHLENIRKKLEYLNIEVSSDEDNRKEQIYNEIHLGGPTNNRFVNRLFKDLFTFFEWDITEEHYNENFAVDFPLMGWTDFMKINEEWEGYKIGDKEYKFNRKKDDWAFLLRIRDNKGYTTHVLFGIGTAGRNAAINYLFKYRKQILKDFGNDDYLLAIHVDYKGDAIGNFEFKNILPEVRQRADHHP